MTTNNNFLCERTAIFPGSFDPFTRGHESVLRRGLLIFDRIIIGVGINADKPKSIDISLRIQALQKLFAGDERILVEGYSDLTVDFAARHNAKFILRGIRCIKDYDYEFAMADLNRKLSGIETVFLPAEPQWGSVSSSSVRELLRYGRDISPFIPEGLDYK